MTIPKTQSSEWNPLMLDNPGHWLLLSDVHLPYHDEATVELALKEAKRLKVTGILLNGDILDSGEISFHEKHSSMAKYKEEIEMGVGFLKYVRSMFPKARIVYKQGNHEARLDRYVINRAEALAELEGVNLPSFLHMQDRGIEWVRGGVIKLGKLAVVHGHEFGGGGGGVNPARWLYLQAGECSIMGHFHRTSEHHERDINSYISATWSVGCACDLHPHYRPINKWNHGFATVEIAKGGSFRVSNRRVLSGEIF